MLFKPVDLHRTVNIVNLFYIICLRFACTDLATHSDISRRSSYSYDGYSHIHSLYYDIRQNADEITIVYVRQCHNRPKVTTSIVLDVPMLSSIVLATAVTQRCDLSYAVSQGKIQ